jgi:uncharacterized protein (TIGR02452 family)
MTRYFSEFDHRLWIEKFKIASEQHEGFRELRAEIFQDTVRFVQNGGYMVNGSRVVLDNEGVAEGAVLFDRPIEPPASLWRKATRFATIKADCLETAKVLLDSGLNPAVLNMASRQKPGGGVYSGAGAQEENLFRRSNMFLSLFQFGPKPERYGLKPHETRRYPLDRTHGGAYSPNVTVFRGAEANGYFLLPKPFKISVVTVAAINHPDLISDGDEFRLGESSIALTKEKIRTILRIAAFGDHDSLALSAFGCGAFANPPRHMAELFQEVFREKEFLNRFKTVVFAIIGDHNANRRHNRGGNGLPFAEVFCGDG